MIDRLFSTFKQLTELESDTDYSHHEAVLKSSYNDVPSAETLTVIFPPWHPTKSLTKLLEYRLTKDGSSSLICDFNPSILNSDPSLVRLSFEQIAASIGTEVNMRANQHTYKRINLLGISLGNVALSMTAENLKLFDGVTMVVPGSELATPFWTGIRTRKISDVYREAGYQLPQIRKEWQLLAPIAHLTVMEGHEIQIVLAKADEYIPYRSGLELVEAMKSQGLNPAVQTSNSGHVAAITRYAFGGFRTREV